MYWQHHPGPVHPGWCCQCIQEVHGLLRWMGHIFSSKPSWTPKTEYPVISPSVLPGSTGSITLDALAQHDAEHHRGCTGPGWCCQCIQEVMMVIWYATHQSTASAEGRVEHQKLNQGAVAATWLSFGVQLDYSCRIKLTAWSGHCRFLSYSKLSKDHNKCD